jgi:hypothetical protein
VEIKTFPSSLNQTLDSPVAQFVRLVTLTTELCRLKEEGILNGKEGRRHKTRYMRRKYLRQHYKKTENCQENSFDRSYYKDIVKCACNVAKFNGCSTGRCGGISIHCHPPRWMYTVALHYYRSFYGIFIIRSVYLKQYKLFS